MDLFRKTGTLFVGILLWRFFIVHAGCRTASTSSTAGGADSSDPLISNSTWNRDEHISKYSLVGGMWQSVRPQRLIGLEVNDDRQMQHPLQAVTSSSSFSFSQLHASRLEEELRLQIADKAPWPSKESCSRAWGVCKEDARRRESTAVESERAQNEQATYFFHPIYKGAFL